MTPESQNRLADAYPNLRAALLQSTVGEEEMERILQVYNDLAECKDWWNLSLQPCKESGRVFIAGHETQNDPQSLVLPVRSDAQFSMQELEELKQTVKEEFDSQNFLLGIVAADTSVVYYRLSGGLVPPERPEDLQAKKDRRQRYKNRQKHRHMKFNNIAATLSARSTVQSGEAKNSSQTGDKKTSSPNQDIHKGSSENGNNITHDIVENIAKNGKEQVTLSVIDEGKAFDTNVEKMETFKTGENSSVIKASSEKHSVQNSNGSLFDSENFIISSSSKAPSQSQAFDNVVSENNIEPVNNSQVFDNIQNSSLQIGNNLATGSSISNTRHKSPQDLDAKNTLCSDVHPCPSDSENTQSVDRLPCAQTANSATLNTSMDTSEDGNQSYTVTDDSGWCPNLAPEDFEGDYGGYEEDFEGEL